VTAVAALACAKTTAAKPDQAAAETTRRLAKLGDTDFVADDVVLAWLQPLHLGAAQVNGLRRALAENLTAARAAARPVSRGGVIRNDVPFPATRLDYRDNVLNDKARAFYERHHVRDIEPAAESGLPMAGRVVMTTRYCLKYELGRCPRTANPGASVTDAPPEPWVLVDDENRRLRLHFDCARRDCVMEIVYEG
jgi:hypothetical protein